MLTQSQTFDAGKLRMAAEQNYTFKAVSGN